MEFPKLIGCRWCHSGGWRGPQRRGPPLSDGDWARLSSPGLRLVRGGARAVGHLGPKGGEAVATEESVGSRRSLVRRVPSAEGPVKGRSGRRPLPHHAGAGVALVVCRPRDQWGGLVVEGDGGAGVLESTAGLAGDLNLEALPGRRTWGRQRRAWACLVWDALQRRGPC